MTTSRPRPSPGLYPAAAELSVAARLARVAAAVTTAATRGRPVAVVLRGVSGAGKTTLARQLGGPVVEADDLFVSDGGAYAFDPRRLTEAHGQCFRRWCGLMSQSRSAEGTVVAVVANTGISAAEISPYVLAAQAWAVEPLIVRLVVPAATAAARATHGVPASRIEDAATRLLEPLPPFLEPLELVLR